MSKAGRRRRDRVRAIARDQERLSQVRAREPVSKTWHVKDDHGWRCWRDSAPGVRLKMLNDHEPVAWGEGWGTALSWYESFPDMVRRHRPDWARRLWHWLRIPCPLPGCEYKR